MTSVVREPLPIPSDETVRWTGAPRTGLLLRPSDWYVIPFSLLWAGFAVFWETVVIAGGAPVFFWIWGIPFVCIGAYAVAGRFFWEANVRSRTRYVVTDRAAYVVVSGFRGAVRRYAGAVLDDVRIEQRRDGSGTLRFGPDVPPWGLWVGTAPLPAQNAFEAIRDLDHAYDAVRAAARG